MSLYPPFSSNARYAPDSTQQEKPALRNEGFPTPALRENPTGDADGSFIGAVGVSAGTNEQDQEVVSAGATAHLEFAIA
ncbi:heme-binding protein [Arthrobacter sp. B0490]|uniref:heme-binding protein n=1 Tax=Arthrobacter sp. B0490 TaxID=2058891 RepID=UPI0011AFDC2E|nr:heme-binding protein [Arthrobacter sp. B0490]